MNYIDCLQQRIDNNEAINFDMLTFCESILVYVKRSGKHINSLNPIDELFFNEISRKFFESKTIAENREIALRIGIRGATSCPKCELVDLIMQKIWKMQHFDSSKQKHNPIDFSLVDDDCEMRLIQDALHSEYIIGEYACGLYEKVADGGIIRINIFTESEYDVAVTEAIANMYDLRNGDFVKCRFYFEPDVGFNLLYLVEEREENVVKLSIMKDFPLPLEDNHSIDHNFDMGEYDCFVYCYGQSYFVNYGFLPPKDVLNKVCHYFHSNNVFDDIIPILIGNSTILSKSFSGKNSCLISCDEKTNEKDSAVIHRVCLYAWSQAKYGKRVAIILMDGNYASYRLNNTAFTINDYFSNGGAYKYNGSVTCFAFDNANMNNNSDLTVHIDHTINLRLLINRARN